MDRQSFYDEVRTYLVADAREKGRVVAADDIGDTDNLFDIRVVNSFSLARLLVHIEGLTDAKIDVTSFEPETFFTLAGMYDALHREVESHG